jgi:hypothetical protein
VALDLSGCTGTETKSTENAALNTRPYRDKLVSLILPDTLTTIGLGTFNKTSNLVSVNLSHITSIPNSGLSGCTALTSADLSGVTNFGVSVFGNCEALNSVLLSPALTEIPKTTFSGCSSLTTLELPASVATIGQQAFINSGLLTLIIKKEDGVVTLAYSNAFTSTPAELSIYVPDALINDYKTTAVWSNTTIAKKIKGHSELP